MLFEFQQDNNNTQKSKQRIDQEINRGLALLVLLTVSVVGSSWLFSLPVYFNIKIISQVIPVISSLILLFSVTRIQHVYFNKIVPVLAFVFVFCSWSYVVYLNAYVDVGVSSPPQKEVVGAQLLGMSHAVYIIGLCFSIVWLGRYFKYNLYLSASFVITLIVLLLLFSNAEVTYLLAYIVLLVSSTIFSAISLNNSQEVAAEANLELVNESVENDFLLPSEIIEQEIKPELDINVLPLTENTISHDWELILRELQGELKNTTDVDQLFKRMLVFLHGAMDFDAAAVGMLQDRSIKKIASTGADDYLNSQVLNWTNQRVKEVFASREPILSVQINQSPSSHNGDLHRLDVPVVSGQKVVGLVTLFRDSVTFDTNDVMLAASIVFHSMLALRQARLQDEVKRLKSDSPVTKLTLYSREQFVDKIKPVFEKLSKPRECSLFIVEIDNLDSVIDTKGRDAGTLLFKAVSKTIMSYLSERDILGKYGNEGFVVLQDEADLMHAKAVAEKIREKVSQIKLKYQNEVLSTTVSIGLTIVSNPDEGLPSLMRKADMGLFVAKENGCNTVKVSF